jgi:solute:Na+ symporter, SSS family
VSSSINSAATAYSVDIHYRFGWSKEIHGLKVARITSVLFGLLGTLFALILATGQVVSLWDEFIKIIGLIMGGFGGLFLLGMLTRRANGTGAIIGIIGSMFVQYWVSQTQVVHVLLYVATGCLSLFIIGYIASLLTPKSKKDITNLTIAKPERKKFVNI